MTMMAPFRMAAVLLAVVLAAVPTAAPAAAEQAGPPGAGAGPGRWRVTVVPQEARPGEFVAVVVAAPRGAGAGAHGASGPAGEGPEGLTGELAGQRFAFYGTGDGRAVALVAVSYHLLPGRYPLVVRAAGAELATLSIQVGRREFPVQRLTVSASQEALVRPQDPALVERRRREEAEVEAARSFPSPRPLWEGPFIWPLEGPIRITSEFGLVREVNGRVTGRHSGLDLAAPAGTPVRAANAGRVVLARDHLLTGNTVIIDHGWGLFTSYLHLSAMAVREGQMVRKGEVIGEVGATGFATGPHLHWAAWLPGAFVDPRLLLDPSRWPPSAASPAS